MVFMFSDREVGLLWMELLSDDPAEDFTFRNWVEFLLKEYLLAIAV
jgi:hypothetical protein